MFTSFFKHLASVSIYQRKHGNYNEVLFIAFIMNYSATRYHIVSFSYMELSKPVCHSSQSVIVTTGIICPHLKPLYCRRQSKPFLQYISLHLFVSTVLYLRLCISLHVTVLLHDSVIVSF